MRELPRDEERSHRLERDSLGEIAIPAFLPYGARTERNRRALSFSGRTLGDAPSYLLALFQVKKACARANLRAGAVDDRAADAIAHACDALANYAPPAWFPVDMLHGGGSIGINTNVNEVIANLASERLGAAWGVYAPVSIATVNASQSTADVCHTAARLGIRHAWDGVAPTLRRLIGRLEECAARFRGLRTMSRTCLRDALPVGWDAIFSAYATGVERRLHETDRLARDLARVSLGGTVVGSGAGAPRAYREAVIDCLIEACEKPVVLRESLYDAAQNADDLGALSASLARLAQLILKLSRDLRLLASGPDAGFGEIFLPKVVEGSSFFAGKTNPVVPETLIHASLQVIGHDRAAQGALEQAELQLNVFESLLTYNVLESLAIFSRAIPILSERCIAGIEIDLDRMRDYETFWRTDAPAPI